jgi:hypothetical protein
MIRKTLTGRTAVRRVAAPMAAMVAAALTAQAAPTTSSETAASEQEPTRGAETGTILTRSSRLWGSTPWQQLKALWRRLDIIAPGPGGYGTYNQMESDSSNYWRLEAQMTLEALREEAPALGIDSLELEAIFRLVDHRIQLLCWGSMLPMTRMMPPPVDSQIDDVLIVIEQRIDAIRELRGQNVLGSSEMRQAFAALTGSVEDYAMLGVVSQSTGYSGALYLATWPVEADLIIAAVDSARTANLDRIALDGEAYAGELDDTIQCFDQVLSDLDAMQTRLPALTELIRDLELFDPGSNHMHADS